MIVVRLNANGITLKFHSYDDIWPFSTFKLYFFLLSTAVKDQSFYIQTFATNCSARKSSETKRLVTTDPREKWATFLGKDTWRGKGGAVGG